MSSPVVEAEASDARKTAAAATSSGGTRRLSGVMSLASARNSSYETPAARACSRITASMRGPATAPGEMRFTRTPCGPSSTASERTSPTSASLLAA
jgi:hypothetical protein